MPLEAIDSMQAAINRAMTETCFYVADTILQQKALLLPAVHEYFSATVREYVVVAYLEGEQEHVTTQWILSNLVVSLGHHLSYACRIRKCGTLLYRTNGDLLKSLTVSLHTANQKTKTKHVISQNTPSSQHCSATLFQPDQTKYVNSCLHKEISKLSAHDATNPFQFHTFDIDKAISNVDKSLWSIITLLTTSISERRGTSRVVDHTSPSYVTKRIRRFYCLCCLIFCTDN